MDIEAARRISGGPLLCPSIRSEGCGARRLVRKTGPHPPRPGSSTLSHKLRGERVSASTSPGWAAEFRGDNVQDPVQRAICVTRRGLSSVLMRIMRRGGDLHAVGVGAGRQREVVAAMPRFHSLPSCLDQPAIPTPSINPPSRHLRSTRHPATFDQPAIPPPPINPPSRRLRSTRRPATFDQPAVPPPSINPPPRRLRSTPPAVRFSTGAVSLAPTRSPARRSARRSA